MDRSARITDLLEQAAQHEIRMAAIQDESNAVGTADIRQWRNDYQQWYAEALATEENQQ